MSTLSRRQLLLSTAVGALFGAGWGASFIEAELSADHPTITVYRSPDLFSMLVEYESARILMLHGESIDQDALSEAAHSTTGFLRHRLDIVLASDTVLRTLPAWFMERWKVSAVYALPDRTRPFSDSLDGRQITVGDLAISSHSVPFGAWNTTTSATTHLWYLEVAFGSTRCVYGSAWEVLDRVAPPVEQGVTMSITNDATERPLTSAAPEIIAAPSEAFESLRQSGSAPIGVQFVRLYRDVPTSVELGRHAIITPDDSRIL